MLLTVNDVESIITDLVRSA